MPHDASTWIALRIDVADDAADAVTNFLLEEGAPGVLTAEHELDGPLPPPGRAQLEAHVAAADAPRVAAALRTYLASLATVVPGCDDARITLADVPPVDWEATFRRHHHPVRIGRRLLVAPPWDVPAADGRVVLVIEPGMAFGTGQHETTRTCLEEIEALVDAGGVATALDVGTGSGLLAAALCRLGVRDVTALDNDVAVLPLARTNLDANGAGAVRLLAGTASSVHGQFDVVVANLLADALVVDAAPLAALVAADGHLVVSGLLDTQVERVVAAYPGWRIAATRADGPWRTLRLERTC
ncbi:MAG TPA: 50S ribosomal protein L11 methyltransferase [Candidatus Binatia bacterium]|nr:50S ribosomal protein L11 methyltransferase [Candidatus Binatia bacterium]